MDHSHVRRQYAELTALLIQRGMTITTMESATSGQIASLITDSEGSSAIFKGAFVTYSNEAKVKQGVPSSVIQRYGVYSQQTALAMAAACRDVYSADIAIGVTGTMGNVDPANGDSVLGQVHVAIQIGDAPHAFSYELPPQPTRLDYKMLVASKLAEKLFELLG